MDILCRNRLIDLRSTGTRNEKKVSDYLLHEGPKKSFNKLSDISDFFGMSNSSVTRFIKKLGYPTFKHFIYELNSKDLDKKNNSESQMVEREKISRENCDRLKKKYRDGAYLFVSSRRAKAIAKFARERLNIAGEDTRYFHEHRDAMEEYISSATSNDTIILMTLTGWSNTVSKAVEAIAKLKWKPQVFIFTICKWSDSFDKYDYIEWITINKKRQLQVDFKSYNYISLRFIEIITMWVNDLWTTEHPDILL